MFTKAAKPRYSTKTESIGAKDWRSFIYLSIGPLTVGLLLVVGLLPLSAHDVAKSQALSNEQQMAVAQAPANLSVDLCAKTGSITLPDGVTVDIWGFALKPLTVPCTDTSVLAGLPGPTLEVTVGGSVTVTLYNALSENVSILFPGQNVMPDTVGVAPGSSKTYTFTASNPGTYLYESGTNTSVQVPMGLYGAVIVRPAALGQAYNTATSAYDAEATLVLSEIDPAQHANPAGFNLLNYAPKYWLINGKAYPQTATIPAQPGARLLLRYLNAGLINHTMTLIGTHQRVVSRDAYPLAFPYDVVAETIPSGQTLDTIARIPYSAAQGTKFPLYNRQLHVSNVAAFPGGMLTFVVAQGAALTNQAPVVNAGPDQTITLPASANLDGTVSDDGLPYPPGAVTSTWTKTSGPGTVTFGNPNAVDTTAAFSAAGNYVLRLTASDGAISAYDEVTITVNPAPIAYMHVGDLDGTSANIDASRWRATVTVTLHNGGHSAVANAKVSGTWSAGDGNGRTLSCTTDGSGQCSLTSGRLSRTTATSVTFTVSNVTHATLTYQSSANHDPESDSNGTSIIVNRP